MQQCFCDVGLGRGYSGFVAYGLDHEFYVVIFLGDRWHVWHGNALVIGMTTASKPYGNEAR